MIENEKKENTPIQYELIDVDGLCTCLSDDAWEQATNANKNDLYESIVTSVQGNSGIEVKIEKQIKSHWANQYFLIYESFKKLILSFRK